jgi:hypothetical protein
MRVSSWDPANNRPLHQTYSSIVPVADLIREARLRWAEHAHGNPSVDFERADGSCLTIATDGSRAFLVWTNNLGEAFQSVGTDQGGSNLIYDYSGSYSEAPSSALVSLRDGIKSIEAFLRTGAPDTPNVLFSPT